MIGESEAREITSRALELAGVEQAEAILYATTSALTRFARNTVHQNVAEQNRAIYLRLWVNGRTGTATTNRLDDRALRAAVERARRAASESPTGSESAAPASAGEAAAVEALDRAAAECTPEQRAESVRQVCEAAAARGAEAYGAFEVELNEAAFASHAASFRYHAGSRVDFQTVVRTNGSSGWARGASWRLEQVPVAGLGEEALKKAIDGGGARQIEPEPLPVVLDPYATADLLSMLNSPGMGAKAVAEGRSWMNERIGVECMSRLVSIWDDGTDPGGLPAPFDSEGTAKRRVEIVSGGVVRGPVHDRATASAAGAESTGHALPLNLPNIARRYSPLASNLYMAPGEYSTEELIASTERGLYITRFWYTRHVHPRDCVVTGMTRDGVFLIENGKIGPPVKDLRFTQSYVEALGEVEMVGRETRLISGDVLNTVVHAPALKIKRFRFTGATV